MGKKWLSLLLSMVMMVIVIPAVIYGADGEQEDVKVLKKPEQAIDAIHRKKSSLKSKKRNLLSKEQNREEVERRIIFKSDKAPQNTYGAVNIFYYEAGKYFILEYNSAKKAKEAVKKLEKDYPRALVLQDKVVSLDETVKALKQKSVSANKDKSAKDMPKTKPSDNNGKGEVPTPFDGWKALGLDKLKQDAKDWDGGVTVGVIDSGINKKHPWFKTRLDRENSINFAADSDDKNAYDDPPNVASSGHGTHVSGIIAKGTPDQVKIIAIRVFDITGSSSIMTITMAVDYAREKKIPVLNMSLGHPGPTKKEKAFMNESLQKSLQEGTVMCVASGNEFTDVTHSFPASNGITMAIGSMEPKKGTAPEDEDYIKSDFSNNGKLLDFVAPGRNIESAHVKNVDGKPDDYEYTCIMSGTSMATPYMASEAAMVKWKHPEYNQWDVYATFQDYAKDIGPEGKDDDTGYGYVDFRNYAKDDEFQGKRYQGISAGLSLNKSMDDVNKPIKLDAKVTKGDGKLTFASTDTECVQIRDDKMIIKGAGDCEIIATVSETEKYKETRRNIKIHVEKGTQSIKVSKSRFEKKLGDKTFAVKAKVTVGDGKLEFVANENDVLDVNTEGKVRIKGTGTAEVFAIAGNTRNYNRCVSSPIRITVAKKDKNSLGQVKGFVVKPLKGKKVTGKWKKVKGASGYQISYSVKKGKLLPLKATKKTVILLRNSKFKKGKTYYFAVRAYKVIHGKKIYGKYCKIQKVRMRK